VTIAVPTFALFEVSEFKAEVVFCPHGLRIHCQLLLAVCYGSSGAEFLRSGLY